MPTKYKNSYLQRHIEKYKEYTLHDYATTLFSIQYKRVFHDEILINVLYEAILQQGYTSEKTKNIVKDFLQSPIIQTTHHLTLTNGPTFNTIDILALCAIPQDKNYLVGACSCIPFSNIAWSGALNYGDIPSTSIIKKDSPLFFHTQKSIKDRLQDGTQEKRISLISSQYRDSLVYQKKIDEKISDAVDCLEIDLLQVIPHPSKFTYYTDWALKACSNLQKKILQRNNIVYFDINKVTADYLIAILSNEEHIITHILTTQKQHTYFAERIPNEPLFFASNQKKIQKIQPITFLTLQTWYKEKLELAEKITELLKNRELCPSNFLVFLTFIFLNNIRCLGSYLQIEYLENYRQLLMKSPLFFYFHLYDERENTFSYARIKKNGTWLWPLDIFVSKENINVESFSEISMKEFWKSLPC